MVCLVLPSIVAAETTLVRRVVDGDTLVLADGRKVRLVGINTPELGRDERPDEPLARAAQQALRAFIGGRAIRLHHGPGRFDHYGRTLAYVDNADGASAGEYLLRQGLAMTVAIPPNLAHLATYRKAEAVAQAARRGIWAEPYFRPVAAKRLRLDQTGFRLVTGRIQRVGQSRKYVYLDLTPGFAIAIDRNHWPYFAGNPAGFKGKRVVVRGWVNRWRDKLRIRIGHPAMMEILD